jgi:DNA polymerase
MSTMDRAGRLVRQHAETARLLGVDFVPLGSGKVEIEPGMEARADEGAPAVRDRAASQAALDELRERYERDAPHKRFVTAHTNIVFGEGDPCARLMFIGEAPGAEEDKTGRPFVGRAGKLLDDMIVAMGSKREDVYIGNVLKTRPPNNATPTMEEARLCAPYLFEQIRIISPEVIVTLGLPATRVILDSSESMGRLRGHWGAFRGVEGLEVPVMPTYHPAFLLRSYTPENRRKVWSDLQQVMTRLGISARG